MIKKKKVIIISIVLAIAIMAVITVFFLLSTDKNEEKQKIEWREIYLEILSDEKKLEDINDTKIQLCDLDKDSIPELLIYGINNAKQYITNIYKINEKNEIDTVKVSLDNEFDLKLLYNLDKNDYVWYAVEKKSDSTRIYDLNIETKKYEPELLNLNFENDFYEVKDNYSEKVDFDKSASKSEKREVIETAKERYISTEKMITDEVKADVELAVAVRKIEKIDSTKGIVYSSLEKDTYKYPIININTDEIKNINSEIKRNYGFTEAQVKNGELAFSELEEISYRYTIDKNILSLFVWKAGNDSIWGTSYNIDLINKTKMKPTEILENKGLKESVVIAKAKEAAEKEYDKVINAEKNATGADWENFRIEENINNSKSKMNESITKLEKIFIDTNKHLYILAEYEHLGGQYTCTQTIAIDITDNYSITDFKADKVVIDHNNFIKTYKPNQQSIVQEQNSQLETNTSTNTDQSDNNQPMTKIVYDLNVNIKIPEGTYKTELGTLTIKNSTGNSFDFEFSVTNGRPNPNLGNMEGTAKAIQGGNFAYEEHNTGSYPYDYNVFFYIAGGDNNTSITVKDECSRKYMNSPYCGNGVTFQGTYTK